MSKEENPKTIQGTNNPMAAAPYHGMIEEIYVMLVDLDKEIVGEMIDLLKSFEYKVMTVDASTAMAMLSNGKKKIDAMIINIHSPYFLSFEVLIQAVALDIISLVIFDEHKEYLIMKAFSIGAYIYLKKPLDKDIVKYLWQFVLRKRIKKEKDREGLEENRDQMNVDDIGNTNVVRDNEEQAENDVVSNGKYKPRKKRSRESMKEINEGERQIRIMRKNYTNWTADLHTKFMKATQHLGEGRCLPKKILKVMNVPSLTRTHIASHLQKCRNGNWKAPKDQKSRCRPSGQGSSSGSQQRCSIRKFGTMSCLQENIPNHIQRGLEFPFPTLNSNIFARGESLIQPQFYRPRFQVQSHNLNIVNPFNSSFFSAQNNDGGELQQQQGPLFGMLESQRLQGLIIGSNSYKPDMAFNSKDHHGQNDHNLNVNVVNVTTYSGSAIMTDTNAENATINELGASNANFQQYFGEQNMSDPSNIVVAPDAGDSNEKKNCDVDFDFNFNFNDVDFDKMNFLFQNLELPSSNLPNKQSIEFDQAYSDDQVTAIPSIQFQEITIFPDEYQRYPVPSEIIGDNSQKGSLERQNCFLK
ncbi:putative two-component response regulator ARR13 [Solanum dulcamara]|uniref:putative two-component response regulator ARR13 n=1 Tax=Solanum dulcamara TaxID=45834 RepID=UPI002486C0A0|nr:putative two-component response regulator ARR13 [Solanum dulcamara]